jgi:tight adherence protein C
MSGIVIWLIGGAVFGAIILLSWYAFQTTEAKITGKSSLRAIESYTWQNDEIVAKEKSFYDRVIGPIFGQSTSLGRRFTPVGYIDSARKKLTHAGLRGPEELDKFLAIRALTIGVIPFIGIAMSLLPNITSKNKFFMFLIIAFILAIYPDAKLSKAVSLRQKRIRQALPDILDLLTISVEAGLGFEQAVDRITESVPGPLSDEFTRMIGEMRAGANRSDALNALETRTGVEEVKSFVMSMVQADTFGVSIGRVLRAQADEMRIKRRQLAQEAAQKAPVKMLLPMTFFIFPALFVVVLGPAIISIAENFK